MNPNLSDQLSKFLNNQLVPNKYQLSKKDKEDISRYGLSEYIFSRVTSAKFRRTGLDNDTISDIKFKIKQQMLQNAPISFSIPFGAYKNWHLASFPDPDWAEVFNIAYLIKFLSPISEVYEPGAALQYSFVDDVMDIVSNIPKENYKNYIKVFLGILNKFQESLPKNIFLRLVRINDFYTNNELFTELHNNYIDESTEKSRLSTTKSQILDIA